MPVKCPSLSNALIFSDDAQLAARLSCVLAKPGSYLPVIDGPRAQRPDREAEIIRRINAAARSRARRIFLAGLSDLSADAPTQRLPKGRGTRIHATDDLGRFIANGTTVDAPQKWGRDHIGVGLLQALRARRSIVFQDEPSPKGHLLLKSDHLVVCEEGDEFAQVIAANYAYSIGAGLFLIQETPQERAEQVMERFYSLYESQDQS